MPDATEKCEAKSLFRVWAANVSVVIYMGQRVPSPILW